MKFSYGLKWLCAIVVSAAVSFAIFAPCLYSHGYFRDYPGSPVQVEEEIHNICPLVKLEPATQS